MATIPSSFDFFPKHHYLMDFLANAGQDNDEGIPATVEEKLYIISNMFSYSRIIYVIGGAGFGKSLFLKKLCVDPHLIDGYSQKPFLVLRGDIKNMIRADGSIKPMLDFLEERLTAGSFEKSESIGPHFLEDCLKAGRCLILLDALDEVGNDIRTELHELIVSFFQETYPGNRICITSRERGFIPKKDIDCYYISRIKKADIEQYIDRFIALDKFAPDEKQPFLEKASVLVSKGFIQGFLTLSLLLAIYKNESSLPTNKLLLYGKCFEYIANSREQGKKLLKNSKTGEEYDWNALGILLQDATFMEFASLGYPNNRDVSVHDIEETIFSLYGGRFESKTRSNIVSEMFLQFCSDRTEVFVPSQYSNDAYRFFHRSFFDYFYAKYIEWKTKTVDETLELIYKLDIDSEAIELLMTIYSQRSPRYLRELVEKALRNLNESLDNKKGSSTYLDSLILMMQDVEEIVYCQKFIRLLFDREEKIRMVRIKTSFDLVHALFNKHYVEYLKQYADHIESMSNNAKRQILNTMFKEHGSLTDWIAGKTSELPLPTSVDASTGINAAKITFGAPNGLSCINNWIESFSSRAFLIGKEKLKSHNADIISEIAKSIKQLPQEKREYLTEWIVANT